MTTIKWHRHVGRGVQWPVIVPVGGAEEDEDEEDEDVEREGTGY